MEMLTFRVGFQLFYIVVLYLSFGQYVISAHEAWRKRVDFLSEEKKAKQFRLMTRLMPLLGVWEHLVYWVIFSLVAKFEKKKVKAKSSTLHLVRVGLENGQQVAVLTAEEIPTELAVKCAEMAILQSEAPHVLH